MLKPSYLEQLPEPLVELVSELENEITADIAARVIKGKYNTPSSEWLMYKANQLRMSSQSVNKIIAKKAKTAEKTVREIYTEAVTTAIKEDMQVYEYAVKDNIISKSEGAKLNTYFRSIAFNDIFRKGLQNTNQLMRNLTNSMAKASGNALIHAMDLAWLEVASGAYTPDEAVYKAVKNLADKGIAVVTYEKSGEKIAARHDQVDVAVRRAVRTSINKTCCDMQLDLAGEMGCDLVEVTSHLGARPTHADWQGQVYSLSGKHPKYKPFSVTGYGTGDGLGGWNCRHSFYPYFEGLSERASVPSFTSEENEEYYKLTQKQRALERDIRKSKRELALTDAARQSATDEEWKEKWNRDFERQSATLKRREKRLDDFCKQNNLYPDGSRTRVAGFGKSISQKAVHAAKNYNAAKAAQNTGASGQGGGSGHAVTVNAVPSGTNGGVGKTYGGQKINKNSLTSGGNSGKINSKGNKVSESPSMGSLKFSDEYRLRLKQNEKILSGNKYETAVIYNDDGTIAFQKKGNKNSVVFTKQEIKAMNGKVLTHNHPNASVLSPNDINIMRRGNLSEIRACNGNGAYVIRRSGKWSYKLTSLDKIKNAYYDCMKEADAKYADIAAKNGEPLFKYFDKMDEEGLAIFCKKYNLSYTWESGI